MAECEMVNSGNFTDPDERPGKDQDNLPSEDTENSVDHVLDTSEEPASQVCLSNNGCGGGHMRTRKRKCTNVAFHPCPICGQTFAFRFVLNCHLETHSGEDRLVCSVCGKTCKSIAALKCHMKVHTQGYSHCCKICETKFAHKSHLERHMHVHTCESDTDCAEQCTELSNDRGKRSTRRMENQIKGKRFDKGPQECCKRHQDLSCVSLPTLRPVNMINKAQEMGYNGITSTAGVNTSLTAEMAGTGTLPAGWPFSLTGSESVDSWREPSVTPLSGQTDSVQGFGHAVGVDNLVPVVTLPHSEAAGGSEVDSTPSIARRWIVLKVQPLKTGSSAEQTRINGVYKYEMTVLYDSGCPTAPDEKERDCHQSQQTAGFVNMNLLNGHARSRTGKKTPYQCTMCKGQFVTLYDLKEHKLIHKDGYTDTECDKKYPVIRKLLNTPMKSRGNDKPLD